MKYFALLVLVLTVDVVLGQQLVIDPGLEDTLKCPQTLGRFYHATNTNERYIAYWRSTTLASCDLHNLCGYNNYMPRTGAGYAGIIMYDPAGTREYITAMLSSPLEAGECYYVEFYVALKGSSTIGIEEVQAHFSDISIVTTTWLPPAPLPVTPHIQASVAPTLTTYQKVSGIYTAAGGEDALTIGNFENNNNTTVVQAQQFGSVSAYYFIDDVTVTKLNLGPDRAFCEGDSAIIISNITCPDLTYQWSNGDTDTVTVATDPGNLSLTVSMNGASCSLFDEVYVDVVEPVVDAGPDQYITPGGSANLQATGNGDMQWSPASSLSCTNCPNPIANPVSTQVYTVTLTDSVGCEAVDSVTVTVSSSPPPPPPNGVPEEVEDVHLFIPNAFTPDGDLMNDVFLAEGGPFKAFQLNIFDRWGKVVFTSENLNIGWNGSINGVPAPPGIYVYRAIYSSQAGRQKEVRGSVALIR